MPIADYDNTKAIFYGELVNIAYLMYEANPNNPNPLQPSNFPAAWKIIVNITVDPVVSIFSQVELIGFIVQSTSDPSQVGIVFRGSQSDLDWIKDVEWEKVLFKEFNNGSKVDDGFLTLYRTLKGHIPGRAEARSLGDLMGEMKAGTSLTIAGHSLGGALAILHAAVVVSQNINPNPDVYTYAAPMVGDKQFATTFNGLVLNSFRIANTPDIVPLLPGEEFGYRQVDTTKEIDSLHYRNIKWSIDCFHSILTYLYVLGSRKYGLGDCQAK